MTKTIPSRAIDQYRRQMRPLPRTPEVGHLDCVKNSSVSKETFAEVLKRMTSVRS